MNYTVSCSGDVTCPPNFITTDDSSGSGNDNETMTNDINTSTTSMSSKIIALCEDPTMTTSSVIASNNSLSKSIADINYEHMKCGYIRYQYSYIRSMSGNYYYIHYRCVYDYCYYYYYLKC